MAQQKSDRIQNTKKQIKSLRDHHCEMVRYHSKLFGSLSLSNSHSTYCHFPVGYKYNTDYIIYSRHQTEFQSAHLLIISVHRLSSIVQCWSSQCCPPLRCRCCPNGRRPLHHLLDAFPPDSSRRPWAPLFLGNNEPRQRSKGK